MGGYLIKAVHTFQVRTLKSIGLYTRATLSNKSHETPYATDYRIDLTIYGPERTIESLHENIGNLKTGQMLVFDCDKWNPDDGKDRIMIFHFIPVRMIENLKQGDTVAIENKEVRTLISAQDHYVEYYRGDGFSSGVLYQSGSFNYAKFSTSRSTLIQAPKVTISNKLNTYLNFFYTSFDPDYHAVAKIKSALLAPTGKCVAKWSTYLQPFESIMINLKEIIYQHDPELINKIDSEQPDFYTYYGLCENAVLVPLTMNFDESKETFTIEHALPPYYYGQKILGQTRTEIIKKVANLPIFIES